VDVISEESTAWEEGYKVAVLLGLPIHCKRFSEVKAYTLITYYRWAVRMMNRKRKLNRAKRPLKGIKSNHE
jgi:hypothetical protein